MLICICNNNFNCYSLNDFKNGMTLIGPRMEHQSNDAAILLLDQRERLKSTCITKEGHVEKDYGITSNGGLIAEIKVITTIINLLLGIIASNIWSLLTQKCLSSEQKVKKESTNDDSRGAAKRNDNEFSTINNGCDNMYILDFTRFLVKSS